MLDAELGKTFGVRRTKGGAGDKQEAFLIRGTLFKGALLCCLLVAVVGGLAIFISQWEVSFQRKINLLERKAHASEETESYDRLMEVGNFLANFLRTETNEKMQASLVDDMIQSQVSRLMARVNTTDDPQAIQAAIDLFGSNIYSVLEEYNRQIESESTAAKELLKQINSVLADEKFLPHSEDDHDHDHDRDHDHDHEADDLAHAPRPAIGVGLNRTLDRFFTRFQLLDSLVISQEILDKLEKLVRRENIPRHKTKGEAERFFKRLGAQVKELLSRPGVRGVDVSMQLPGRAVIGTVREILAAMQVKRNFAVVQNVYERWKSGKYSNGIIMHSLHRLARERIVPFDWVAGDNLLQRDRRPLNGKRKQPISFADTKNWWWKALADKEGKKPIRHLPFGLKFPNQARKRKT